MMLWNRLNWDGRCKYFVVIFDLSVYIDFFCCNILCEECVYDSNSNLSNIGKR